jgi:phosphoglycerate dehydrogenase-like enzyme
LSKKIENVVITPHVAGATIESQTKAFNAIIKLFQENNV